MLTAMGDTKDRIAGLETGVDDYLGKPFEPRELLLRIQNVLKRNRTAAGPPGEPQRVVCFGPFQFDQELGELTNKGKRAPLDRRGDRSPACVHRAPGRGAEPRDAVQERGRRRQRARHRRAGDAAAAQDRARSVASRAICGPSAARAIGWSSA